MDSGAGTGESVIALNALVHVPQQPFPGGVSLIAGRYLIWVPKCIVCLDNAGGQTLIGLIFDFDGPIYNGRAAMYAALHETCQRFSLDSPAIEMSPLYEPRKLTNALFGDEPPKKLEDIYLYYAKRVTEIEADTPISQEVRERIQELHAADMPLAVLSSRPEVELRAHLSRGGILECFASIIGRDQDSQTKSKSASLTKTVKQLGLPPSRVVLIGDSDEDFLAASSAQVPYYHANWTGEPSYAARRSAELLLDAVADYRLFLQCIADLEEADATNLPSELVESIRSREFCYFTGAGVSIASGIGAWDAHYGPLLRTLDATLLAHDRPLPEALQLIATDEGRAKDLFDRFRVSFQRPTKGPNGYHFSMLRARAARIWTLNYDHLFEDAVAAIGTSHIVVHNDDELLHNFGSGHLIVKMNGDFESAEFKPKLDWGMIFLEEQFDLAERNRREILRLFEDDYRNNAIVFVGISFRDPALRRVLSAAAKGIPKSRRRHYLLTLAPIHPMEIYLFRLYRENLRRRNIETLFFADFERLERFVRQTAVIANRPVVGFSGNVGKAAPSGSTLNADEIAGLCAEFGRRLAERGFRVTSGHGANVGVPSVEAAFTCDPTSARFYLRAHGRSTFSRTAPAVVVLGDSFEAMRERFVSELELLVAIGGETVNEEASGTVAEIELALAKKVPILLVPQGGGDVLAYSAEFRRKLDDAFPDPTQRACIVTANETIAGLSPGALSDFANEKFIALIGDVIAKTLASPTRRVDDGIAQRNDVW